MTRAENKAERLLKMEALLLSHPEGLTQSEIARRLNVDRSVIHRNLYDFGRLYPVINHDDGRISIDRSMYLLNVSFTLHEAMAVHLASRLLATRMDRQNPHAASALRKLGISLEKLAPRISAHVKQSADVMDEADQRQDPVYLQSLEKLTLAWAEQRKVQVWHRSDKTGKVFEYLLCPYFIEPYAVGQTTHVIGRNDPHFDKLSATSGKMRTLKIERIERVELTRDTYEIPADFDPRDLLADAWGIWYTENEPVEVVLKFHRNVSTRVRETRWHRSEEEIELQDGSIVWKAKVAEPQEMIPWIRAWGSDVEVLEPKELREKIASETIDLARKYGFQNNESIPSDSGYNLPKQEKSIEFLSQIPVSVGRKTMYYDAYVTSLAKTNPEITLFEHSSDVLQVANYLIEQNIGTTTRPDIIKAGALVHDVGKMKNDRKGGQWIHSPHSAIYLEPLLDDPRFQNILSLAQVDMRSLDRGLLLQICEEHHNPSPKLLRQCKDALLVSVADALASSIGSGTVGSISEILKSNPYMQINFELLQNFGFTKGLDGELHHIDLPGQFTEDLFLADMIFRVLDQPLRHADITPLLQKKSSLWVVGKADNIQKVLNQISINPKQLYDNAFDEKIYDSIIGQFPPGAMQIDILKYLLVSETIARKMAVSLYTRDKPRKLLEKYDLSYLVDTAGKIFANGLSSGIDSLWSSVKLKLLELAPDLDLPIALSADVEIAAKEGNRLDFALFKKPKTEENKAQKTRKISERAQQNGNVLKILLTQNKQLATDVEEFLKLFDCSLNAYRSLTNILLELIKMQKEINDGTLALPLRQVVLIDGQPLETIGSISNSDLCPICRRLPQELRAPSLITGRPEGDSKHFEYRRRDGAIEICRWCFLTGYIDLPIASFVREGNSIIKDREFLFLTSPLSRDRLQRLLDFFYHGRREVATSEQEEIENEDIQAYKPDPSEMADLEMMMGSNIGYDELSVLGVSRRRISYLKGFVLETANMLSRVVCIRIPFERLVSEDKVSGAVRHELVKATMYDLHLITGAPSIHFGIVGNSTFSVNGKSITLPEMQRANLAYRMADKDNLFRHFNKTKKMWQLDSALYMLLINETWKALNLALRKARRDKRFPLGEQKIQEVIEMAEKIAQGRQWKFELGQKITGVLVDIELLPKARSFWKSPQEQFSGVELTKWLQRLKMARDETGLRQWGNQLINALKAGRTSSRDYKQQRGITSGPPSEQTIGKILSLVEEIISVCAKQNCRVSEFVRDVSEMDYVLLFSYNQKEKENKK